MIWKKKYIMPVVVWCMFIGINGLYYLCYYMGILRDGIHAENYYTTDSVWSPEVTEWHDDTVLYTLFKGRTVYINPNSWYITYVKAFSDNLIIDENLDVMIDTEMIEQGNYTSMNHMGLVSHSTLFEAKVLEAMVSSEEGLSLFIDEESVYTSDGIIFLHDESGNIYLKGADNEE